MNKRVSNTTKEQRLWTWIGVALFSIIFFAIILFLNGDYSFNGFSDALFIPGFTLIAVILFMLVGRAGTFDIVSYGFVRLGESFRKSHTKSFEDAYQYSEYKKEQRIKRGVYALPFLIIGGLFVILALIFALINLQ
jgi:hypothetical protein